MRQRFLFLFVSGFLLITWTVLGQSPTTLRATLEGFEEVPAVSTAATGDFQATVDAAGTSMSYVLQYTGLSANATQGHIHFSAKGVNGGISIWLCGTAALPGPAGTPTCPETSGTVMRTVTAADVVGPAGQGIAAGEFAEILKAMREGAAYANVHSGNFGGGEIRGQIRETRR
jgi:hypothetical protein